MRTPVFLASCFLVWPLPVVCGCGADSPSTDPAPTVASREDFVGTWQVDSHVLTQNSCPFKDEDFLRPEVEGELLHMTLSADSTLTGTECDTRDPASCRPDYATTFDFADGVATFEQNRIRAIDGYADFACENHQRDRHSLVVSGDLLTATTETDIRVQGDECDTAEAAIQAATGKDNTLDGCHIVWLMKAHRVSE